MKRAAIYARVSTTEQVDNYSLPTQVKGCKDYAARCGFQVVAELVDDISGSVPIENRPNGFKLYEMIESKSIDAVIVYTIDRLSRDEEGGDYIDFKSKVHGAGLDLHFTDSGLDAPTYEGRIIGIFKALGAGEERMKIRERTMRGRVAKAKHNELVMIGHPPFGYRRNGKGKDARMEIYGPELQTVKDIFNWYVKGDGFGGPLSLMGIAEKLQRRGDPTPHYRSNAAERWIPATIRGILTNEIYAGRSYYGKTKIIKITKDKKRRIKRPPEEWIPINIPELAMVDRGTFEAVQDRSERNKELARRNRKRQYLLSGHFKCGSCGSAMAGTASRPNGYETIYYRCGNHWRSLKGEECEYSGKTVITSKVDTAVWGWIENLMSDERSLKDGIRRMVEKSESELEPKRQRLERINHLIEEREKKLKRFVSQFGDEEDETLLEAIKGQMHLIAKEKDSLQAERDNLEFDLSQRAITPAAEEELMALAVVIRDELEEPDYEAKRYVLDRLNTRVVFHSEDKRRWLDVTCGLAPEGVNIELCHSSGSSQR